jgi:hypothetical protein|tara:strand:- start:374 stop:1582 length:1209 start_codon:yes stop_codon:yes gene_type:complete
VSFFPLVKLRRASTVSKLDGAVFTCSVEITPELKLTIEDSRAYLKEFNGSSIEKNDDISLDNHIGEFVQLSYKIPRNNTTRFYQNFDVFLGEFSKTFSNFTECLPEFYAFDDDIYFSTKPHETDDNKLLSRLNILIKNIIKLEKLAHYHDGKNGTDRTLVYLPGEQKNPVILSVHLSKDLLQNDIQFSLLNELTAKDCELNTHYSEKINIFYASLHEFLTSCSTPNEAFVKLITAWTSFGELFRNNIQTYLSGFSFQKAKKEIVEAELELSEKLTNLTSDIVFKLFSVPASIIALAAILQKGTLDVFVITLLFIGVVVTIILMYGLLVSQQNKYESLVKAKELIFNSIDGNEMEYPIELQKEISTMKTRIDSHFISTRKWLNKFKYAIFSPLVAITLFIIWA